MHLIFALIASIAIHALGFHLLYSLSKPFGGTTLEGRLTITLVSHESASGRPPQPETDSSTQSEPLRSSPSTDTRKSHDKIGESPSPPLPAIPLSIANSIYYPRNELTRPPTLVEDIDLSSLSRLTGSTTGRVALELYINEGGGIDHVEAQSDDIPDNVLEELHNLILQLKFSGGEINGTPVKTHISIEVLFIATQPTVGAPTTVP